jgi:hypothetical protein
MTYEHMFDSVKYKKCRKVHYKLACNTLISDRIKFNKLIKALTQA